MGALFRNGVIFSSKKSALADQKKLPGDLPERLEKSPTLWGPLTRNEFFIKLYWNVSYFNDITRTTLTFSGFTDKTQRDGQRELSDCRQISAPWG